MFSLIFSCIAGAVLNRLSGTSRFAPGRNIYYTAPAAGLLVGLVTGSFTFGVLVFAGALCYRIPGWYALLDMGRNNPDYFDDPGKATMRDFFLMIPRQAFYITPAVFIWMLTGSLTDVLLTLFCTGLFGAFGYLMGHALWLYNIPQQVGLTEEMRKPNWWAEVTAGAFLGGMTWVTLAPLVT